MFICRVCSKLHIRSIQCFSTTVALGSGHNRWSKIKHDKAKEDLRSDGPMKSKSLTSAIGFGDKTAQCCS